MLPDRGSGAGGGDADISVSLDEAEMPLMTTRRRRRYGSGRQGADRLRVCPHCGRTFKRTEHLERHVRTHTKEKPFACHCGATFSRRDLLTRHRRIAFHEDGSATAAESPSVASEAAELDPAQLQRSGTADAHVAAAVSLSGLSVRHWTAASTSLEQPLPAPVDMYTVGHASQRHGHEVISYQQGLPEPFFESDNGVSFDPHFTEFANFLDGMGLPAEWSPYFHGPDRYYEGENTDVRESRDSSASPHLAPRTRLGTPFSSWLPSAPTGNRISNNLSEDIRSPIEPNSEQQRFRVADEQRARLCASLETFRDIVGPDFRLPSRHALTRYMSSFFEGFHSHLPLMHQPTWRCSDHPLELILGMATIGAQYCFDHRVSESLFHAGKAIVMERLLHEALQTGGQSGYKRSSFHALQSRSLSLAAHRYHTRDGDAVSSPARDWGPWDPIGSVRALVCLMGYATWEPKVSLLQDAFALRDLLAQLLRDIGLGEDEEDEVDGQDELDGQDGQDEQAEQPANLQRAWHAWIDQESARRSKLIAFSFMHIHSVAYNVYPVLRSNEVRLRLPCSTREWKAPTAAQWQLARRDTRKRQLLFQDALSLLFRNANADGSTPLDPIPTPLGNYVLLHGILQRIHIVRDLGLPTVDHAAALQKQEVDTLERGLRSWTSGWQQAPESSLDPNNENGPIPFTSSSLLALAYVRIYLHLGPYRKLDSRDPARIAEAIYQSPGLERNDGVIAALLYATHMLSIPVRLGVDRVARSQAFFWSVRHSLSGLDCAILLSKWLLQLDDSADTSPPPLSDSEDRILHWVRTIVEEAYATVDLEADSYADTWHGPPLSDFRDHTNLSLAVLKIWAHFFRSNTQWLFINLIGESLEKYRELLIRSHSRMTTVCRR